MKILLVQPTGHIAGSMPAYTVFLSNALANAAVDVTVVTFDGVLGNLGGDNTDVKHISICSKASVLAYPLRLLERFLNCGGLLGLGAYMDTFLTFLLASRQAKKQKYDAIHILDAHPLIIQHLILASTLKDYTLVSNLNYTYYRYRLKDWYKRLENSVKNRDYRLCRRLLVTKICESWFVVGIEKMLYHKVTKRNRLTFTSNTKEMQESYKGCFFDDRIAYVPWGMQKIEHTLTPSQARQHLNLTPDDRIFLSFGVNHKEKNLEVIFQAIQNLPRDFKVLHAGKIDHVLGRNDPTKLAEKYGWSENTIIEDRYIPEDEMPYYFLAADAIILSYTKDFLHASGVLTHAAGFSLPVIASDVGQLGEFVKTHKLGLTFITEDAKSLREAIISFLNLREEEKLAMKRNLEKFAATFSWEEVAKRHLNLYQGLSDK